MSKLTKPYQFRVLENGLTVLLVPMDGVRSLTVLAMVGTGSRFEVPKTAGISHFLEHMVFKGTSAFPTARELSSVIDAVGAEFNAYTSKEYTGYYVKAASEHVDLALDVVSDMLLTPKLREEDLEREKGVIIEELHMYEDTPMRHIGDIFEDLMFAGSGLGRPIIGTQESIRSFHRDDFVSHLEQWYGMKNVCFVIAGDSGVVNEAVLVDKIERSFAKPYAARTSSSTSDYIAALVESPISTGEQLRVSYKDTQQAHFILSFPGLKRSDPDRYALGVLSTLLGGNMSSRLFTEVREKRGLCYYVHSDEDHFHDAGMFGASAGVDPTRIEEAIRVVNEQLHLLLDETGKHAITEEEVAKAKSHIVGSTILQFEDPQAVAQFYAGGKLLQNSIETIDEKVEHYKQVTLQDVRRVAKQLIKPERAFFAVIGPYKDEQLFHKLLF